MPLFYFLSFAYIVYVGGHRMWPFPLSSIIDPANCTECSQYLCPEGSNGSNCSFGTISNPYCNCCQLCLKGEGESCGGFFSIVPQTCADGLECEQGKSSWKRSCPGTCVIPLDPSIDATNCTQCSDYYNCNNETCDLGSIPHPYCDCCTLCLKGEGEDCSGPSYLPDVCADGLTCAKQRSLFDLSSEKTCINDTLLSWNHPWFPGPFPFPGRPGSPRGPGNSRGRGGGGRRGPRAITFPPS